MFNFDTLFTFRHSSQWMVAGAGDPQPSPNIFLHGDSPATGRVWMTQGAVAFDKLKLTNNRACAAIQGQICLHSMHKYLPKVHVRCEDSNDSNLTKTPTTTTFVFPETVFTTVTAYQNQQVTTTNLSLGFEICFRCLSNKWSHLLKPSSLNHTCHP